MAIHSLKGPQKLISSPCLLTLCHFRVLSPAKPSQLYITEIYHLLMCVIEMFVTIKGDYSESEYSSTLLTYISNQQVVSSISHPIGCTKKICIMTMYNVFLFKIVFYLLWNTQVYILVIVNFALNILIFLH